MNIECIQAVLHALDPAADAPGLSQAALDPDADALQYLASHAAKCFASDEAKATARYLTGTNREGGVGMAVEQYLLNA